MPKSGAPVTRDASAYVREKLRAACKSLIVSLEAEPSEVYYRPNDDPAYWKRCAVKAGVDGEPYFENGWMRARHSTDSEKTCAISADASCRHTFVSERGRLASDLVLTSADLCKAIRSGMDALVEATARELEESVRAFVQDKKLHTAVLCNDDVLAVWPWSTQPEAGQLLDIYKTGIHPLGGSYNVPKKAAFGLWGDWMAEGARRLSGDRLAAKVSEKVEAVKADPNRLFGFYSFTTPHHETGRPWLLRGDAFATIMVAEQEVRANSERMGVAIDAGKIHHRLVSEMDKLQTIGPDFKENREDKFFEDGDLRLYIAMPDGRPGPVQLALPMDATAKVNALIVETLNSIRNREDAAALLRHYCAIQRLMSVEGGRTGRITWTINDHMRALGYCERRARDKDKRRQVSREVQALARLEIHAVKEVRGERKRPWAAGPIFIVAGRHGPDENEKGLVEVMDLSVNSVIYDGVRVAKTGKIGHNFGWAPAELAKINHVKFLHAHALGIIFSIRFRLAWNEGRDFVDISGGNLLRLAGIDRHDKPHARPKRAWETLEKNLAELERIGSIGPAYWKHGERTREGVVRIPFPLWITNRTLDGVAPVEKRLPAAPATGHDLREWRTERGLTQREAAERLGVSTSTIKRAERKPKEILSHAVADPFRPLLSKGRS